MNARVCALAHQADRGVPGVPNAREKRKKKNNNGLAGFRIDYIIWLKSVKGSKKIHPSLPRLVQFLPEFCYA